MSSIGSILTKAACEKKDGRRAGQKEREGGREKEIRESKSVKERDPTYYFQQ